ncbi:MAG: YCF48-related protein [Proteobacteria bacterium]|nr:YCF48-related protein [Pseudomonadota bacterium]
MKIFLTLALGIMLAGCNVVANLEGVTAVKKAPVLRSDQFQALASNGKLLVAAGSFGAIVSSDNGGTSWKRTVLPGVASLIGVTACPDGSWVALDFYHKVWVADAAASQWQARELSTKANPLAIACDAKGQLWVVGSRTTLLSSSDKGATWKSQDFGEDAILMSIQFIDADNAIIAGEFGILLTTADGGKTWQRGTKIPNDFFPHAALFTDTRTGWVSGLAGVILHTTDGGKNWVKQPSKVGAPMYALSSHKGEMFAMGANGIVLKLSAGEWAPTGGLPAPYLRSALSLGDKGMLVAGGAGTLQILASGGQATAPATPK